MMANWYAIFPLNLKVFLLFGKLRGLGVLLGIRRERKTYMPISEKDRNSKSSRNFNPPKKKTMFSIRRELK